MKKFTLIAFLATLTTVGCVFAAWQFTGSQTPILSQSENVGVEIDYAIVTEGLSGTLTIEKSSGNGKVKMVQSDDNPYGFYFVDETDTNAELFNISYTAGVGEQTDKYNYRVDIKFHIYYQDQLVEGIVGSTYYIIGTSPYIFDANNVVSLTQNLVPLDNAVRNTKPLTMEKLGLAYIDTATELKSWIDETLKTNPFKIKVSAILSHSIKNA